MNSKLTLILLIGIALCVTYARAGCEEVADGSKEGEVTAWFKNLGCTIKKGAEDLGDASKPYVDKIGSSAKDLGSSIQHKYHELKTKLSSEEPSQTQNADTVPLNKPTEKVPLAPIMGEASRSAPAPAPAPAA